MLEVQENVDIRDYCTLKVGGKFRYLVPVNNINQLPGVYAFAKEKKLPLFILGSGSNIVFPDGVFQSVVAKIECMGIEIVSETNTYTDIKAGAGENWDAFVGMTVSMNLSGIEAMSAIPGTVGATPVQNVGAYGQETKDTLLSVEVFEIATGLAKTLSNAECAFAYRDSIFKNDPPAGGKGKYVITAVTFRLSKNPPTLPNYPGVKKYFDEKGITTPTLLQIREAIIEIRRTKLPNPKEIANVGSFFKNPIVETTMADELKKQNQGLMIFPVDATHTKVPAGWLIEHVGLKGKNFGPVSVYQHNALVLVNNGTATRADMIEAKDQIINTVFDAFGIKLETEPEFV